MYKELKLKANHNHKGIAQFCNMMLPNVQRAKVESKSQLKTKDDKLLQGCIESRCYQMYKELKLKANHNKPVNDVTKCTKS